MNRLLSSVLLISAMAACDGGDGDKSTDSDATTETEATESEAEVEACEGEVGLEEGNCAPDFTLLDQNGDEFTLSELYGKRVAIIGTAEW